jgi:TM2 domain-containing membrane protein YozV
MSDPIARGQSSMADGSAATHRDVQTMMRYDANKKSVGVAYVLWFFFGTLGGHRFYRKRTGTAIVMLIVFVVSVPLSFIGVGFVGLTIVGIWTLVDAFLIPGLTRDYNNRLISSLNV